jgi:hypothetical protein
LTNIRSRQLRQRAGYCSKIKWNMSNGWKREVRISGESQKKHLISCHPSNGMNQFPLRGKCTAYGLRKLQLRSSSSQKTPSEWGDITCNGFTQGDNRQSVSSLICITPLFQLGRPEYERILIT